MSEYIRRAITDSFRSAFWHGKILVVYGPRQSGKTTFVKSFLGEYPAAKYFQCEQTHIREILSSGDLPRIMTLLGDTDFVIFDNAQLVDNIGQSLMHLHKTHPKIQIIVTSSISFDLQKSTSEILSGHTRNFILFPFLYREIRAHDGDAHANRYSLEHRMLYGSYHGTLSLWDTDAARSAIIRIAEEYALKDILIFSGIRKLEVLMNLLKILAYSIWQEVSYGAIAADLGLSIPTVENYINILEKAYIIFRLTPYSGERSSGIKKMRKIYFWDTGLRNALIHNFGSLEFRPDRGALFENFFISEFAKKIIVTRVHKELSFWRAYIGTKIDLIVRTHDEYAAYDMRWKDERHSIMMGETAPIPEVILITRDTFSNYL